MGDDSENDSASICRHSHTIIPHIGVIYFLFGFTYVIYATFIVTTLVNDYGFSEQKAGYFWVWIGGVSLVSGPLFGMISDRIGRAETLMLIFLLQTIAYLLVGSSQNMTLLYLSMILFGLCVWSIPAIIAVTVADYLGVEKAVTGLGLVTLFFGFGQITGPALAGVLAEYFGSFSPAYLLAGILTLIAAGLSLLLKQKHQ